MESKHFLDSSVIRPLILGSRSYRYYLKSELPQDWCYTSSFVQMELRRGYLMTVIAFFFTLDLRTIGSIEDGFALWSNRFQPREIKAVLQLASQLFAAHKLDHKRLKDKRTALIVLGQYIRRIELKFRRYKNPGKDSIHCSKGQMKLNRTSEMRNDIKDFSDRFESSENSNCEIRDALLSKYRKEIEEYVRLNNSLKEDKLNKGFKAVASRLEQIIAEGIDGCSCCEKVGDAVIALDAPREMVLEALDYSFDYLCPPIKQPHRRLPSEAKFVKENN
jgi:hypothetical protein